MSNIKIFDDKKIRTQWNEKEEDWYFSVKENLRDNMSNIELVLNMLAEVTTTELSQKEKPATFKENKDIAKRGGKFAGETRERYEKEMGRKIISPLNANNKKLLDDK